MNKYEIIKFWIDFLVNDYKKKLVSLFLGFLLKHWLISICIIEYQVINNLIKRIDFLKRRINFAAISQLN